MDVNIMNKKIKSLIVAGMMVVGMSGNVFANETDLPAVSTSVIEHPEFDSENNASISLQADGIQVNITKNAICPKLQKVGKCLFIKTVKALLQMVNLKD